jgi:signal transduction histidine kinase
LLTTSLEKNVLQLEPSPFDVRECLADTLATFNVPAQQKRIHLSSLVDPGVPAVVVQDKSRVSQVLFNLLGICSSLLPLVAHRKQEMR